MKQLLGITIVAGLLTAIYPAIFLTQGYSLDNPTVGAQYQTYPFTDPNEPPGEWKCKCSDVPGMADYHLNPFQGTLQLADMPLTYQAAFGPSTQVRFHYDSGDTSENGVAGGTVSGLQHSNLGPKWKLNWVQFIEDQPAEPGTVALNMGRGGASLLTLQPNGTYARPGISNDVLVVQGANSYLHRLSDGTSEVYATVAGPGTGGIRHLFLTSVSDRAGNTLQLAWQAEGGGTRLSTLTDAAGKVTTFAYDATNPLRLTKVTDPFGRFCTLQYRATGELWKITDPVEIVSEFDYAPGGGAVVSSLTTPYGTTNFSTGVLLTPAGQPNGTYTVATDPLGHSERIERATVTVAADMPANEPVPDGFNATRLNLQNTFYWSKQALASGASVANARIIRWAEDFSGAPVAVPVSVKAPLVNRQWFTYAGQADIWHSGTGAGPASVVQVLPDASVQTTQATYTAKGRVETTTDAQGRQTLYDYLANGDDLWKVRHIAGAQTDVLAVFENYDNQGHPWTVTGADGTQTQLTYNGRGQALSVTNALGEQTTFAYQENAASPAFGRRTTETAAVGTALAAATSLGYDDSARVHTITNQDQDTVTLDYDAIGGAPLKSLDRVTTTTGPDGSGAWVLWNRLDVGERHEFYPGVAERVTTYTHNDNRELTDVLRPSGKTLSYVPGNCCGTMDTLVDAAGSQTHWEHDVLGRVTDKWLRWEQDGQVKVQHLEYDAAGRLATAQDARGNVKTYGYDAGSRLHTIQYTLPAPTTTQPTADVTFNYDPAYARLQTVLDGTGTTTFGFVPINPADTVYGDGAAGTETKVLPDGTTQLYSFSRAFDALGRVNSGPRLTSAHWDALGRPLDTTSGLGTFGFGFEAKSGRLAQVDATLTGASAVLRTGLAYQGAGTLRRLTGITHQTGADTNSLGALSQHGYGYDGLGRLASWQKWIGAVQASAWTGTAYDGDDQLKEVAESDASGNPAVAFGYGYDDAGNRTAASRIPVAGGGVARTWSANGLNQLTAQTAGPESGAQFAYDDDGNQLGDGARSYEWDAENRLVAVNYNNGDRVAWSYDAFHRRVKQTDTTAAAGVVVHDLIWEGLGLIESRASQSGTPGEVRRYYGNGEERLPAGGTPVTRLYYTTDHLGSIRELVDATGAVRARYDYDPYGARSANLVTVNPAESDFGFTGHYTHAASGLVLAPYRGYDPGTGRWLNRDPIGEEGGINLYRYVTNSPIVLLDPLGLWTFGIGLGGTVGLGIMPSGSGQLTFSANGWNPVDWRLGATESAGANFGSGGGISGGVECTISAASRPEEWNGTSGNFGGSLMPDPEFPVVLGGDIGNLGGGPVRYDGFLGIGVSGTLPILPWEVHYGVSNTKGASISPREMWDKVKHLWRRCFNK